MKFIKKMLIKDYQDTFNPAVRLRYGIAAGLFGIVSNILLFAFKLAVGLIGGSITIVADAVNNLSDAGSSVITVIGFRLSRRPADKEHPFGHARYEYITGLLVAFLVLAVGVLLAKSSIEKIISPLPVTVTLFTYIVLSVSILAKLFQMLLYRDFGKAIKSDTLRATGTDSRNDILATTSVLISSIIIDTTGINVDGYFGLAVSLFIAVSAIKLIRDTVSPLLGVTPDKMLVAGIKSKILSYEGVLGLHDLMVHSYGGGNTFVIVHVEVDARVDIMASHDLMDNIEREIQEDMGIKLSIHMDPIETDNDEVNRLKELIEDALFELDGRLSLHDFRIVKGVSHTNILFDAVLPYDCNLCLSDIEHAARSVFAESEKKYYLIIGLDRTYL